MKKNLTQKQFISILLSLCIFLASCGQKENSQNPVLETEVPVTESPADSIPTDSSGKEENPGADKEGGESWERPMILLSDHILNVGDTLQTLYATDENMQNQGLNVTLHTARLCDSPEDAGLDKSMMKESTENYDLQEEPIWCSVDDSRILVCVF